MKPMLAFKLDEPAQARLPVIISPKLDGIRCVVVANIPCSRNMKKIPNKAIYDTLKRLKLSGLDGELIVGPPTGDDVFRRTTSGVMSQDGEPDWTFWVFDDFSDKPFSERLKSAARRVKAANHPRIKMVPHSPNVGSPEQIDDYEARYLAEGYEGIMGRDPRGLYKQGRSGKTDMALWKLKRFADAEATIIGFDEQMHNANEATKDALGRTERSSHKENLIPKGTLGALKVRGVKGSPFAGVEFDIGTGLSDAERQEIWDRRDDWLGTVVKFSYLPIGVKDKPRFPVYLGRRKDL